MQISACLLILLSIFLVPAAIASIYGLYRLLRGKVATAVVSLLVVYLVVTNVSVGPCSKNEKAVAKKMTQIVPALATISPCGCGE
jgi:hypothetical protein